ncbi:cell division protein FtsZ [Verrucomicrobiales bacterium]|nr:cell division protein FtsZ [Verrucomicrobiales bacterium]MDA7614293.1 cell division protein FtsZ [Verrucomicrobiales bacterium]
MIEYQTEEQIEMIQAKGFLVKVIGVGGAGSNVLDQIALDGMEDAELICLNTDVRTLKTSTAHSKVQIGRQLTRGLGAGGDPELGILAAEEAEEEIRAAVRGQDMVFICTGLGGGSGSGAAPTVSRIAKEEGAFVVVFATMPFSFEGRRRIQQAETALKLLERSADALITFENDRMGELVLPKEGIQQAFGNADKIISQSVRAITYVVTQPGLIQIGMDDLLTALKTPISRCLFGYGAAKGKNRAQEALKTALRSPLLDRGKLLNKSRNVLVHIVGGGSMTLYEVELLMNEMSKNVGGETQILFGAATDEKMDDELSVTIISSLTLDDLRQHTSSLTASDTEPVALAGAVAERESSVREDNDKSAEEARTEEKEALAKARAKREEEAEANRREAEAQAKRDQAAAEAKAQAQRENELAEKREEEARQAKAKAKADAKKAAADRQKEAVSKAESTTEDVLAASGEESGDDRARREAFERRREELKRTAPEKEKVPAAKQETRTSVTQQKQAPIAEEADATKARHTADDLKAQRQRAQEELGRKRKELEKLLKMEDEAHKQRPARNAASSKAAMTAKPPQKGLELGDADNDLDLTERIAEQPKSQGLPPSRMPGNSAPVSSAKSLSSKPKAPENRQSDEESDELESAGKPKGTTQEELQLEPSRGRFEKAAPTMMDGENLDVPTFFRKRGKKG